MTHLWAEIGLSHHGDLRRAYELTRAIASAVQANSIPPTSHALKIQVHHPAEGDESELWRSPEPHGEELGWTFRGSRQEYWKSTGFTREQWTRLIGYAHDLGLQVVASVFCLEAIDLVAGLVDGWKIPSGQVVNWPLLRAVAKQGQPIAVSLGMREMVAHGMPSSTVLLHTVSKYPTPLTEMGWDRVRKWSGLRYITSPDNPPWGLSDHSGTIWPALMAATLGASVVEVHIIDGHDAGPDAQSSLTFDQVRHLAEGFRAIDQVRNSGEWTPAVELRSVYEPRWFPEEGVMRKSTGGEPPENWWKGR